MCTRDFSFFFLPRADGRSFTHQVVGDRVERRRRWRRERHFFPFFSPTPFIFLIIGLRRGLLSLFLSLTLSHGFFSPSMSTYQAPSLVYTLYTKFNIIHSARNSRLGHVPGPLCRITTRPVSASSVPVLRRKSSTRSRPTNERKNNPPK